MEEKIMDIQELTDFANELFEKSGKTKVAFAEELGISRTNLYKALTEPNPSYVATKEKVLNAFGYGLHGTKYSVVKL